MLVSVIIPVYNVRPYLCEALDSVINQTHKDLEIIVIDDGSTDGSGDICDAYAERDSRVTVIHQENRGLGAARNAGLERMTGDAVAFLDSDDAYAPDFVKLTAEAMICKDADMVVCRYTKHGTAGKMLCTGREKQHPRAKAGLYNRRETLRALECFTFHLLACSKLYARTLWEGLRFPEGHAYEDMVLAFEIADRCERVYMLEAPLYLYRRRPDSITGTMSLDVMCDQIRACVLVDKFVEEHVYDIFGGKIPKRESLANKTLFRLLQRERLKGRVG